MTTYDLMLVVAIYGCSCSCYSSCCCGYYCRCCCQCCWWCCCWWWCCWCYCCWCCYCCCYWLLLLLLLLVVVVVVVVVGIVELWKRLLLLHVDGRHVRIHKHNQNKYVHIYLVKSPVQPFKYTFYLVLLGFDCLVLGLCRDRAAHHHEVKSIGIDIATRV